MASAAPRQPLWPRIRLRLDAASRTLWTLAKQGSVWFVPMILTSGSAAYLSYIYNQKANTELALQQQTLSDLQSFRNSGAGLDQAVSALSDALVDGTGVSEARSKLRGALTSHISDAVANEKLLGANTKSYIAGLSRLRQTVDDVDRDAVETQARLWQESLNLMSRRRKMASAAIIGLSNS